MSKKKNVINVKEAILILQSYGYRVEELNYYQFRVRPEESDDFFDWYHTTGSLVQNTPNDRGVYMRRVGTVLDPEDLAEVIYKAVYE